MSSVSVVVPVLDGAEHLRELLESVQAQGADEVLVIDSGSSDGSVRIARDAGVRVIEIPKAEFGHGRTRNLGAEETSGDLIWFLTQDATPAPGALEAFREAFALDERVGAAYGPHLPREGTSPMIARELTEFFAGFAPDGRPALQRRGGEPFLSNVNACYRRECWAEVRFRDLPYSEDQAFGRDMLAAGWVKAYHPRAAVLHAHDYPALGFMRRYFDEYRGLRASSGHVEPFHPLGSARHVAREVRADQRWLRERGAGVGERARWAGRSAVHHAGRRVFSALGSRAERMPAPLRRTISLEGRDDGDVHETAPVPEATNNLPPAVLEPPRYRHHEHEDVARILRDGPAALLPAVPGIADRDRLHIAVVIPPFRRGSGGHMTIFRIVRRLEQMGHTVSIWLHDSTGQQRDEWAAVVREGIREHFQPIEGPVFKGFDDWFGADVVLATGWQTVYPVLALANVRARAYLVQDHEPEFYATSTERLWAERSYGFGMYCIAASPWLRDLVIDRYGVDACDFVLGVDPAEYVPRPVEREPETVVFYGRYTTPRRAVPLGAQALGILRERRPGARIVVYGADYPLGTRFAYDNLGLVSPKQLSWVYSQGTIGLSLSQTNFSLIPKEMMACGMPVVELAGISAESIFGSDGPIELAEPDPYALAAAMDRLLSDRPLWEERSRTGRELVRTHTWDLAAQQVEQGLREALRIRERAELAAGR
jgi:glycosyltransferase involved in cell wall biosynthesis